MKLDKYQRKLVNFTASRPISADHIPDPMSLDVRLALTAKLNSASSLVVNRLMQKNYNGRDLRKYDYREIRSSLSDILAVVALIAAEHNIRLYEVAQCSLDEIREGQE